MAMKCKFKASGESSLRSDLDKRHAPRTPYPLASVIALSMHNASS
jgi:hypothetical protein